MLTNRRYSFKHTSSAERGVSDHHHLIQPMMKTTFKKEESNVFAYRDYKKFKSKLLPKFHHNNVIFTSFENNLVYVLNQQAPKVFCRNQKLQFNKALKEAIMKLSQLKNNTIWLSLIRRRKNYIF